MNIKLFKAYVTVLCLLVFKLAEATHVVGGEIYYEKLAGNNYAIHMKVYRDCLNGIPPFDDPAFFTIFDAAGNVYTTLQVSLTSSLTVPPSINSPCAPTTAGNACVEEGIYSASINLPPLNGGYYIVYQRCCRNGTILNLFNPGSVGATYWEHIPGPEVVANNSSPRFTNRPPIYICNGIPLEFDHVATDPDGDSLVYTLCNPFDGLDALCPVIDPSNSNCPAANTPPPYVSVPFLSPYSPSYPMSSNPAMNIDFNTGFLDGVPDFNGQWVVGVCVEEYRNGVLIGTHHRDFQFNVISCPLLPHAKVVAETNTNNGAGTGYCNGFNISFQNASTGPSPVAYHWDFGNPSTLADTSIQTNPSYTYSTPGVYTITLIIYAGTCTDTAKDIVHVYPLLSPDYIAPSGQCFNGNHFNFNGGGAFQGTGTFNWSFGSNANPQTANTSSVSNVVFNSPGSYPIVFSVSENSCTATATKTIQVWQNPVAALGTYPHIACDPLLINFNNMSSSGTPMSYLWTFSDGTTSTLENPIHSFSPAGIYNFTLSVMTSQNCIDTSSISSINSITVTSTPSANFNYVSATGLCFNANNFSFTDATQLLSPQGFISWNFGTNASISTSTSQTISNVSFSAAGSYPVTLIAVDNGCSDTITKTIELYENPIASVAPIINLGCDPMSVSFSSTSSSASSLSYLWEFSDGATSTLTNPTHIFSPIGIYDYSLTVITNSRCIDTSKFVSVNSITVNPSPVASFSATPLITSIFEPDVFFSNTSSSPNLVNWLYDFADGTSSSEIDPMHTYSMWGDYYVTQTVTNTYACSNSMKILVKILPEFRFWIPNAFTPGNKDGLNDVFRPMVIGVEDYTFMIFNRWGQLIYKTTDIDAGWNGTYLNKPCTDDVYVWKCDFKNIVSKENESRVGHVTLVR